MGFYIRKSVSLFPGLRLNFSKSGVGLSVGVRGFHVGRDARGRGYVSGGAGGLYFREYARGGRSAPAAESPEESSQSSTSSLAIALPIGIVILVLVALLLSLTRSNQRPLSSPPASASKAPLKTGRSITEHTVVPGDTLTKLAQRFYGSSAEWKTIYDANRNALKDPNRLDIGMKLRMPAPEKKD